MYLKSVANLLISAVVVFGQSYSVTPVTPTVDRESRAAGLNDSGGVVGSYRQDSGDWHAFLFNGTFNDLGTLGGRNSESLAINNAGDVVGASDLPHGDARHAFLYRSGQMYDLNSLVPAQSGWLLVAANSMNDAGQIVGVGVRDGPQESFVLSPASADVCNAANQPACFTIAPWRSAAPLTVNRLFQSGLTTNLNSLIRPDLGWVLADAVAMNDSGQITGNGLFNGHIQTFLLTPLQPQATRPATIALAAGSTTMNNPLSAASLNAAGVLPLDNIPSGAAGGVLAGNYPNPLLAGIAAGPVVFGNGAGTIGQDSSFTFNSTRRQLSLINAPNMYNSATLNLSKGAGSSSVLDLTETDYKGKILRVLQPVDQAKQTPTVYINDGAGLFMRSWITLSGTTNGGSGDGYNIVPPSNDPEMLAIWADVGTGVQVRTAPITGAYNYSNLDRHGNYTMSIEEDGSLKWGATTRAAMDAGVSRDSAGLVEVNQGLRGVLGDLKVRNLIASGAIQFSSAAAGSGTASLGGNSPAAAPNQPFTWISVNLPDGSQGWIPVWK